MGKKTNEMEESYTRRRRGSRIINKRIRGGGKQWERRGTRWKKSTRGEEEGGKYLRGGGEGGGDGNEFQ